MKSEIWESFFTNFRCRRLIHCKIFDFPYFYKTCSRRQKVWETIIPISVCSSYRGIPLYPGGSVAVWWSGSDWDCCQRSGGHAILSALLERPTYLISFFTTPSFLNVKVVLVWSFRRICDETLEYFKIGNRFETHWLTFKVQSQVINPFTFDLWKPQKKDHFKCQKLLD